MEKIISILKSDGHDDKFIEAVMDIVYRNDSIEELEEYFDNLL